MGQPVQGNRHHDNTDRGSPVKIGGKAKSSAPSAVSDGDRVDAYFDTTGRLVVKAETAAGADVGGGTQYTEGDTDTTITGTAAMWEDGSDTLRAVSAAKPLPVNVVAGAAAGTQYTEGDTDASITGTAAMWEDGSDTLKTVSAASPLPVNIVAGSSSGVQYTEGDTDATITGTAVMWEDGSNTLRSVSAALPLPVGDAGGSLTVDNAGLTELAAAIDTEVQVDVVGALPAGDNNIGNVDVVTMPVVAVTQSGTWDEVGINDSGNSITVDNGGTFATQVDGAALTALQLIDDPVKTLGTDTYTEATSKGFVVGAVRRDADTTLVDTTNEFGPLQMDANGRLKVEAFSGETLPVSDSTAQASLSVLDDWDESDRAKVNPIVGQAGVQGNTGVVSATTQRVVLATDVALPAGTNAIGKLAANSGVDIGDVDVTSVAGTVTVGGVVAHASPTSGNPVYVAGRASNAIPTDVGADGDAAGMWTNRHGAQVVTMLPHSGLVGDPFTLTSKTVQVTTAQTGTDVVTPTSGKKLVVTNVQIQAAATTAATMQLWFGANADTTYSRGTDLAIFDGEFAPSATLKPGINMQGPFIASAADHEIHITTSANLTVTVTVWYYEI